MRLLIRFTAGALLSILAACQTRVEPYQKSFGDQINEAYTSHTLTKRTPYNAHGGTERFAISPDGHLIAVPFSNEASNQIYLINPATLEALLIEHVEQNYQLHEPSFSHDGQRLAVVASPAPFNGISQILILDLNGEVIDRIAEPQQNYSRPVFSPDGTKLLYFKDLWRRDFGSSEYQASRAIGNFITKTVFQFDLASRTEEQLVDLAWFSKGWVDYSETGDAVFFRANVPYGRESDEAPQSSNYLTAYGDSIFSNVDPFENVLVSQMSRGLWPPAAIDLETSLFGYEDYPEYWSAERGYMQMLLQPNFLTVPEPMSVPKDFVASKRTYSVKGVFSGYLLFHERFGKNGSQVSVRKAQTFERHPKARTLQLENERHVSPTLSENACVFGSIRSPKGQPVVNWSNYAEILHTIIIEDLCGDAYYEVRIRNLNVYGKVTVGEAQ